MRIETVNILGVPIAGMTKDEVLEWIRIMVEQRKPRHVVTANAEIIYKAYREEEFFKLLDKADLITPDGSGVMGAARLLGKHLPQRVTGIDLAQEIFRVGEEKKWSLYFLGAGPEVVKKAVLNTLSLHNHLNIVGYHHGYFSQQENDQVVSKIKQAKPDILLVALGAPKQELFIQEHLKDMQVPVSIGVGGTFDVLAGTAKRAPVVMQNLGLEWLYRLTKEPKRYKRMLALPKFVGAVLKSRMKTKNSSK